METTKTSRRGQKDTPKESALRYFLSLGPMRTLSQMSKNWEGHVTRETLVAWCKEGKWWRKARLWDELYYKELAEQMEDRHKAITDAMVNGIQVSIAKIFYRDKKGQWLSKLKIKNWEDMARVLRIWDYISGGYGNDPNKLKEGPSYHLAIIQLIQEAKKSGNDPFAVPWSRVRNKLDEYGVVDTQAENPNGNTAGNRIQKSTSI